MNGGISLKLLNDSEAAVKFAAMIKESSMNKNFIRLLLANSLTGPNMQFQKK
jgi:hypothetical protein